MRAPAPASPTSTLRLKRLGIDTYRESVIYLRANCPICLAEGFAAPARIRVTLDDRSILATLNTVEDRLLAEGEAGLSQYAWQLLSAEEGDKIVLSHPRPLHSFGAVRAKIYGHSMEAPAVDRIIEDIVAGRYSDIHIAAFLTACAGGRMNEGEIIALTRAMVSTGQQLSWPAEQIVDKHCVGGLPGNRTTLIIVPIVTAFGLTMPKTSSRAITSPAGTADTMEVLAPVDLDLAAMRRVVEKEQGCIVWGGSVSLSPADDLLIGVERVIDLDSEGQLVASVLSKKIAAGSTHIVIDMPIGPTAKVRSVEMAETLRRDLDVTGRALGMVVETIFTDGAQPVGRGIGPALEAWDVLAVLQNEPGAPQDLRERALLLAGRILEFSGEVVPGAGKAAARAVLESGRAWKKFQALCEAQGGLRLPGRARYSHAIISTHAGTVVEIDNRRLARVAKLAGAPYDKTAGVFLHTPLGERVTRHQPLFTVYSGSKGGLRYALSLLEDERDIVRVGEEAGGQP